jgi:hypothetical protein
MADEAFADLLRKHNRPVDLKDALKRLGPAHREKTGRHAARTRPH